MLIIQIEFNEEGGALIKELARRANFPSPEEFVRKAIGVLGAGVQIEELGGRLVAHFPSGTMRVIECISDDGGTNLDSTPLEPPKQGKRDDRRANGALTDIIRKLGWAGQGLQILREENLE